MTMEYSSDLKMSDLVDDNCLLLMVMSRFGISLGFGERTVGEVCDFHNVDCQTFLAVASFVSGKDYKDHEVSLAALMEYLKRAHSYFLDFYLPQIRRKLIEAIDCSGANEVAFLILKFYDGYVTEVRRHMEYENRTVFSYVENLLNGALSDRYSISVFESQHNHIDLKLKELKDIIVRYCPEKENDLLNAVLFDIINCEQDLKSHCRVEDKLFVPAVERLESRMRQGGTVLQETFQPAGSEKLGTLSTREKEIVCCVAKGLSNKEIADILCLSVHTVTTHRRNISSKLHIHTPAGLTIFAIANKLIRLQDLKQ